MQRLDWNIFEQRESRKETLSLSFELAMRCFSVYLLTLFPGLEKLWYFYALLNSFSSLKNSESFIAIPKAKFYWNYPVVEILNLVIRAFKTNHLKQLNLRHWLSATSFKHLWLFMLMKIVHRISDVSNCSIRLPNEVSNCFNGNLKCLNKHKATRKLFCRPVRWIEK